MSSMSVGGASIIDVTNSCDSKIPVSKVTALEPGTQISYVCVQHGTRFDHHGVFIGMLEQNIEVHAKLLKCYPNLTGKFCAIDMTKGPNGNALIMLRSVEEFANNDTIYAHVYKVPIFTPEEIVNRALQRLVNSDSKLYDSISNNCEHFATEIIRGIPASQQIDTISETVNAAAVSSVVGGAVGAGAATALGLTSVVVGETVAVPLMGWAFLGNLGLTTMEISLTTVTAFEAGIVTTGTVIGCAAAGAILAGVIVGLGVFAWKKHSEASQRQQELRLAAQNKQPIQKLEKIGFDRNAINIAFCGGTGRGKSTCINAMLGTDAATVSASGEGTQELCKYTLEIGNTDCKQALVLWDLPGAGTVKHPESSYWEDKSLSCFHTLFVFLESGEMLDFERNIIQRAISEKQPPVALIFGQADRKLSHLQKRGASREDAIAKLREEVEREVHKQFRLHIGEAPPPQFIIAQRAWRQGRCAEYNLDESKLVAFLLRKAVDEELPIEHISSVLQAMAMAPIANETEQKNQT